MVEPGCVRGVADVDARRDRRVAGEHLEPAGQRFELSHRAGIGVRAGHEVLPVVRMAVVGRTRERHHTFLGSPADVVEVQVGEHDVGHRIRGQPQPGKVVEERAGAVGASLQRPEPGVHEHDAVADRTRNPPTGITRSPPAVSNSWWAAHASSIPGRASTSTAGDVRVPSRTGSIRAVPTSTVVLLLGPQ